LEDLCSLRDHLLQALPVKLEACSHSWHPTKVEPVLGFTEVVFHLFPRTFFGPIPDPHMGIHPLQICDQAAPMGEPKWQSQMSRFIKGKIKTLCIVSVTLNGSSRSLLQVMLRKVWDK
jgi:hypothetical protein